MTLKELKEIYNHIYLDHEMGDYYLPALGLTMTVTRDPEEHWTYMLTDGYSHVVKEEELCDASKTIEEALEVGLKHLNMNLYDSIVSEIE